MVTELISSCSGTCRNSIGTLTATSAGSWSGEIASHSPVAISSDKTFSQKLCSTQRRKNPLIADAPSPPQRPHPHPAAAATAAALPLPNLIPQFVRPPSATSPVTYTFSVRCSAARAIVPPLDPFQSCRPPPC